MLDPTGFWSYSTSDDEGSGGRLSQLRTLLTAELKAHIGGKAGVFQDAAAIPPGAAWERQIREKLNQSSFIIPILTPSFLQSQWCCREVSLFRQREKALDRDDLIFPIYYIDIGHVDTSCPEECHDKEVLDLFSQRQMTNFQALRFKDYRNDEQVALKLEKLAKAIRDALRKTTLPKLRLQGEQLSPPVLSWSESDEAMHIHRGAEQSKNATQISEQEIQRTEADNPNQSIIQRKNAARITRKHDDQGRVIELAFFGVDGKPVLDETEGAARITWKHDGQGRVVEQAFFGADGKPVVNKTGYAARYIWVHDESGNVTESASFGIDGQPVPDQVEGAARITWKHDAEGRVVEQAFFGVDGEFVVNKTGYAARYIWVYDERGNVIECASFGIDGNPC